MKMKDSDIKDINKRTDEWERTFNAVPDHIAIIDRNFRIRRINTSMAECLNIELEEAIGRPCFEVVHMDSQPITNCPLRKLLIDGKIHKKEIYEARLNKYFEITVVPLFDDKGYLDGAVHIAHDITELKRLSETLKTLSLIDELTGLYNRRGFYTFSEQQMKIAQRMKKKMLIIFIDINGMKYINDTFGHKEGDLALIDSALILKKTFRDSDIISRFGGDEFLILAIDSDEKTVPIIKERLEKNIEIYNIEHSNRELKLSFSVGIALYDPDLNQSLDELISQADKEMYLDKKRYYGRND